MATLVCSLGPECAKLGVREEVLLSYVSQSLREVSLPQVQRISNRLLLEVLQFKDQHAECTFRTMYCWVKDLFGKKWPEEAAPTLQAFTKSLERLNAKLTKLKKQHTGTEKDINVETFLPKYWFVYGTCTSFQSI